MSTQEKLVNQLNTDLRDSVEKYFDKIEKFEHKFILNSRIAKNSQFENKPLCSHFTIYDMNEIPFTDILTGDVSEIEVTSNVKIATSSSQPKKGIELDLWSDTTFGVKIYADVMYNAENKVIEVKKVEVRSR